MKTVGFIGLGRMGKHMASNILASGAPLLVNDVDLRAGEELVAAGAVWKQTAADVAASCDVLFTSLPTPTIVEAVAYGDTGVVAALRHGTAWFDLSTNSLDVVRRLHADLREVGIDFLDAPVSGGPKGAAAGKLAVWVGGDSAAFERHQHMLEPIADEVRRVGEIGAGTTAKLLHNTVSATIHAAIAEILTVGVKAGIEPAALFETLRSGAAGRRRTFDAIIPRFLAGNFEPASFQLQLSHKDLGLSRRLAQEVGVPTRLCDLVYDELTEAMNRGWGERDMQSFMTLQQERAGIAPIAIPTGVLDSITDNT